MGGADSEVEKTCVSQSPPSNRTNIYRDMYKKRDLLQKLAHEVIRVEESQGMPYVN